MNIYQLIYIKEMRLHELKLCLFRSSFLLGRKNAARFGVKMTKSMQFFLTLSLCLYVLFPFQGSAGEINTSSSSTVTGPPQAGTELATEDEKSIAEVQQHQPLAPISSLITLIPEGEGPVSLKLRNQDIVSLLAEIGGLSPQERVEQYQKRFSAAVSGQELPDPTVEDIPPYGSFISIGGKRVILITYLDIDPLEHKNHEQVVKETVANVSKILNDIREERSISAVLGSVFYCILATLALITAFWLVLKLQRFITRLFSTKISSSKNTLERITKLDVEKSVAIIRRVLSFFTAVLLIALTFTWLAYVLRQFPYTRPWGEQVWAYVLETMQGISLVMLHALPNLLTIVLILFISNIVARMASLFLNAAASGKVRVPGVYPETVLPTRRIIVTIIYLFTIVAVYPYLPGSNSNAFKGLTVLVGLMISLGGSGVINQFMSGLVLIYSRALQAGDYVHIGDTEGVVIALDMLATKIKTNKNEVVTIPNSVILSTSTKNYTRLAGEEGVILYTEVTISYAVPWRKVHDQLVKAANLTSGLKDNPAPYVLQTSLSDFYVEYQLNAFLEKPEMRQVVLAELRSHIQDTFKEAEIKIVSPHYVEDPPGPMPPRENLS